MKPTRSAPHPAAGYLFAVASTAMWSVNFLVARALKGSVPPVSLAFMRWTVAALVFMPFAVRSVIRERVEIRRHFGYIAASAFLGVTVFNTVIYYAGRTTTALNMSLISITFPIIIIVLSRVFFGERISAKRFAGILIVVAGVVFLLTGGRPSNLLDVEFAVGDLLMLVTAAIFASYSLLIRRRPASLSLTTFQFSTFVVGVVFLAPFFVWERAVSVPLVLDGLVISAVLYIGIFASLAAFVSWNKATERIGAAKAGLVYYLMPVFSGLSAWLLLGEPLGIIHLVSMAIIVVGIFLASKD